LYTVYRLSQSSEWRETGGGVDTRYAVKSKCDV